MPEPKSNDASQAASSESNSPARRSPEKDSEEASTGPIRRKKHTKSRNGCRACKKRKVKCDEQKPLCSHCSRLRIACHYNPKAGSGRDSPDEASWPLDLDARVDTEWPSKSLDLLSLELFHSYTEHTSLTLPSSTALRDFWRITVPRLALQHEHVMKSLLALAALHTASCRPEQKSYYVAVALQYHREASEGARHLLGTVTPETATSLFIFSSLTVLVVLNAPKQPTKADSTLPGEVEFIQSLLWTIQGIRSIRDFLGDDMSEGQLAPLAEYCQLRWHLQFGRNCSDASDTSQKESTDIMLNDLQDRLSSTASAVEEQLHYQALVARLREALYLSSFWEELDLFVWLYRSLDDFAMVTDLPTQHSLVIWAHLAVVIKMNERQWWLQGWAEHIMTSVYERLDSRHRPWVYGAALEMGWIIPDM